MKTVTFDESMYVLVPREPTPEMVAVAVLALHETASLGLRNADAARNAWIAMVEETCRTHKAVPSGDDEVRVQNFYSRAMRELVEEGERATQTTIRARAEQLHKAFLANPAPPTSGDAGCFVDVPTIYFNGAVATHAQDATTSGECSDCFGHGILLDADITCNRCNGSGKA